jgi:hypothetical protein
VDDPGRIFELARLTEDGRARWRREVDGSLTSWLDDGQVALSRSERGRVRLTFRADSRPQTFESSDQNITGELVVLWALAAAHADPPRG